VQQHNSSDLHQPVVDQPSRVYLVTASPGTIVAALPAQHHVSILRVAILVSTLHNTAQSDDIIITIIIIIASLPAAVHGPAHHPWRPNSTRYFNIT